MAGKDETKVKILPSHGDKEDNPEGCIEHNVTNPAQGNGVSNGVGVNSADRSHFSSPCPPEDQAETILEGGRPKKNYFIAARGHVQRVVDVALLVSNMSLLATITKKEDDFTATQFMLLTVALSLSMVAQVVAGVCFFMSHQREINEQEQPKWLNFSAYACVGAVMVLNIFISTFHATWST